MATAVIAVIALVGLALILGRTSVIPTRSLRLWLDECGFAGLPLGALAVVLAVLSLATAGLVAVLVPVPVVSPIAAVAAAAIPVAALDAARTRRRVVADAAWPDIIDAVRMALRAGFALHEALAAASPHVPSLWRESWSHTVSDLAKGMPVVDALLALRRDRAEPIADRVCESLIIASDLGGSELPRVLEELSRAIREELRVRREATARQSWVRHAARLGALAPWVVIVLLSGNADSRAAFSSPAGSALIVGCAGATVVAYIVMTSMGRLPAAPRWVADA